jgi:putative restriction endonuclease
VGVRLVIIYDGYVTYLWQFGSHKKDLEATKMQFGEIEGYPEGSMFKSRMDLYGAGLHRQTQAGISGTAAEGADAIVLNGGYEDDRDYGDLVIYTGEGGKSPGGVTVADQPFTKGNKALAVNISSGLPVRVIRGPKCGFKDAPASGYRYDGLYRIASYTPEIGMSGFLVYRYRLEKQQVAERVELQPPFNTPAGTHQPTRTNVTVSRIIRDTSITQYVKRLYDFTCQVCGTRIKTPAGPYAEGAHIQPLGSPHNGPDVIANVLCLCPNHHTMFDLWAFAIDPSFKLIGLQGALSVSPGHPIGAEYLAYHMKRYVQANKPWGLGGDHDATSWTG